MRTLALATLAFLALAAPAAAQPGAHAAPVSDEARAALQQLRTATARYSDVQAALADGYIPDPSGMCVDAGMVGAPAEAGAMGIHYFRPDLLGVALPPAPGRVNGTDGVVNFDEPEVLVYEPQDDGSLTLVAAEYLVFKAAWDAAHDAPPTFHGTPFFAMQDDPATEMDEAHEFEPHYELHVWVHRDNPAGVFQEFNPAVRCPAASHAAHGG